MAEIGPPPLAEIFLPYYALWQPSILSGDWFGPQTLSSGQRLTSGWVNPRAHNELTFAPGSTLGTQESIGLGGSVNNGVEIGANIVTLADYITPSNGAPILTPTTIGPVNRIENTSFGIVLGYGHSSGVSSTLIANDVAFAHGVTIKNFYRAGYGLVHSTVGDGTLLIENTVTNDGIILNQGGGSIAVIVAKGGSFINHGTIETTRYATVTLGNSLSAGAIFNEASITAYGGEIVIGSSVYGSKTLGVGLTGTFAMGNGGTFILNAPVAGSEYIQFINGNGDRLGVNTNPTLVVGATVGFDLPPISGFGAGAAGSAFTQSGNIITLDNTAIPGEITGYSIITGSASQILLLDELLPGGGAQTLALSFAGTSSLDHLTIMQTGGITELIGGGVDFFTGPTSAVGSASNFFAPSNWDLGVAPGSALGSAINSLGVTSPISAPALAEIAGANVYLSSMAASNPAPATLLGMTLGLLGSLSNGVVIGGTLHLDGVSIGKTSTIVTGMGHNVIATSGSVSNFGTIEVAGTSSQDGVSILSAAGSSFTNAGLIDVVGGLDPATIGSYALPPGTFINTGTLEANGTLSGTSPATAGELVINDYVTAGSTGSGTILMTNGGIIELNAGAASNQSIVFNRSGGTLDLSTSLDVSSGVLMPTVMGFTVGDTIELTGALNAQYAQETIISAGGNTTLTVAEGAVAGSYTSSFSLMFAGAPTDLTFTNNATVTLDGNTQSAIVMTAPCFAEGTRILTARGEIPIEALLADDRVITVDQSEPRAVPIKWRGQRSVRLDRHPAPHRVAPIVIEPGALGAPNVINALGAPSVINALGAPSVINALGAGVPHRRLVVSPDHALLLDGQLIEAKYLVNGATIWQDFAARAITYHHLELERHGAVLAEGAAAETFLESGNRHQFEGQAAFALIADFTTRPRVQPCAPLCDHGPILVAIRHRLAAIAQAAGYRIGRDDSVRLTIDGRSLLGEAVGAGRVVYRSATPIRRVHIDAPLRVPAETDPTAYDWRRLSIALRGLYYGDHKRDVEDACFATGFYPPEAGFRWAGPGATLDFSVHPPAYLLTLLVQDVARHWIAPQRDRLRCFA